MRRIAVALREGHDFEEGVAFHLSQQAKEAGAIATAAKRQIRLQIHSLLQISPFVFLPSAVTLTSSNELVSGCG